MRQPESDRAGVTSNKIFELDAVETKVIYNKSFEANTHTHTLKQARTKTGQQTHIEKQKHANVYGIASYWIYYSKVRTCFTNIKTWWHNDLSELTVCWNSGIYFFKYYISFDRDEFVRYIT